MILGKERYSLTSAKTAMVAVGMTINKVVRRCTDKVVEVFGLTAELGSLRVVNPADITVLHDERGQFALRDNEDTQLIGQRRLRPAFCLRDGRRFDADASILPELQAA